MVDGNTLGVPVSRGVLRGLICAWSALPGRGLAWALCRPFATACTDTFIARSSSGIPLPRGGGIATCAYGLLTILKRLLFHHDFVKSRGVSTAPPTEVAPAALSEAGPPSPFAHSATSSAPGEAGGDISPRSAGDVEPKPSLGARAANRTEVESGGGRILSIKDKQIS